MVLILVTSLSSTMKTLKPPLIWVRWAQAPNCGLDFSNVAKGSLKGLKSNSIKHAKIVQYLFNVA